MWVWLHAPPQHCTLWHNLMNCWLSIGTCRVDECFNALCTNFGDLLTTITQVKDASISEAPSAEAAYRHLYFTRTKFPLCHDHACTQLNITTLNTKSYYLPFLVEEVKQNNHWGGGGGGGGGEQSDLVGRSQDIS